MRIALDATYSVERHPSGIAVYSNQLLSGLAQTYSDDEFLFCYRAKRFKQAPRAAFPNVRRRFLLPPLPTFYADLFHALNQRVDRRPAKKVVSTFHDLFVMTGEYSSPAFRSRFTEQARRAAQNSDLIVAVSEFTASQVVNLLGVERSRIRVIPHGVRPPSAGIAPERENIILFVGVLQVRKNVERLVEAFERISGDWRLVLAGAPAGFQAARIVERIQRSPQCNRIVVVGHLSRRELEILYSRSSIFAFPSLDEGFGLPVLEAMSYGVPVITSNRGALREVAGDAALLVNPCETEELVMALNRLIQDNQLRARLSEAGRTRAQLYTWDQAVRATYSIYKELLA